MWMCVGEGDSICLSFCLLCLPCTLGACRVTGRIVLLNCTVEINCPTRVAHPPCMSHPTPCGCVLCAV